MRLIFTVFLALTASLCASASAKTPELACLITELQDIAEQDSVIALANAENNSAKTAQFIDSLERRWPELEENNPDIQSIFDNPVALHLKSLSKDQTAAFSEIFLVDRHGTVIASSRKTSDYFQADEDFFQHVIRHGNDSLFVAGVNSDASAEAIGQKISLPVEDGDVVVGVLVAVSNDWYNEFFEPCDARRNGAP